MVLDNVAKSLKVFIGCSVDCSMLCRSLVAMNLEEAAQYMYRFTCLSLALTTPTDDSWGNHPRERGML